MNNGNSLVLGLWSLYIAAAVISGHADEFADAVKKDAKGFLPWALAVITLTVLNSEASTKPIVAPFAFLLLLNVVLRNFTSVQNQFSEIMRVSK